MSKISSLIGLSSLNGIDTETLDSLGVTDVVLNADTALFIDPLLLSESAHPEIRNDATKNMKINLKE
nr:hypothetical protein KXZ65_16890 [Pectobacterium sp. PL152]